LAKEIRRNWRMAGVSSKKHRAAEVSTAGIHGANFGLQDQTAKRTSRSGKLPPIHHGNGELRAQRGAGKLKALVVTTILIFGIYAGFKLVPPYSAEYQLNDKIQEIARFGVVERKTEEQIRESVFKTIQDLDIPATRDNIKVIASTSKVAITVDYTVPVDLLFYHVDLHFTPTSENKSLT
jgi:hypothetical protein